MSNPFGSRGGDWHLLNKEGGAEIALKPGAIPDGAVIELKGAIPFDFVWENQSPEFMHMNRILPAKTFQFTLPPAQAAPSAVIKLGSPLPQIVK